MKMSQENAIENNNGCIPKIVSSWRTLLTAFNTGHQIYPQDPIGAKYFEFVVIDSKIQIRVIHLHPNNIRTFLPEINAESISKRSSLSEEYWFTRNRPLRTENCNCSFRKSLRYSVISNQPTVQNVEKKRESILSIDLPPTKITNVETFVERLIQETFFEAFQEYYISHKETGKINLAYETTEEDDVVVTLRRKFKPNANSDRENIKRNSSEVNRLHRSSLNCVNKTQNKPLILLLHGIGSSADIWTTLMHNLCNKGFEIIAFDLLGHGFSSAPDKSSAYTFSNLLLQTLSVFDYYLGADGQRKCILIGHSYGCSLITALYPHRSSQISQLILISGGGPTPLAPPVKNNEISPFGCIHTLFHPLLYCGLKRSFFYSSRGKHFQSCSAQSGLPNHVLQYVINGQRWPEGDAAFHRRIMVPTLLVHGLQDKNVTLVQECEMERTVPRAFLELIPNAGHMAMLETPEHLTHMIICFLDMWS